MRFDSRGQTIIEAVVALGAILIIVAAITIAIVNSVSNSQYVKSQNLANKFAQQGMEHLKRLQVENIANFAGLGGTQSLGDDLLLTPGDTELVNVNGTHKRIVILEDDADPCNQIGSEIGLKKVTVDVAWQSAKCPQEDTFCHHTTLVSCIPYENNQNINP